MEDYNYYIKPRMKLYIDIETLPADEKNREVATETSLKKMHEKAKGGNISKKLKESAYRWSAISGDFGKIFCIGYAFNDEKVTIISGSEQEILEEWWKIADRADLFIGHNILDFDLRFIFKRSIVYRIKPSTKHLNLSFARYKSFPIYDTMREWEKWSQSFISLDTLAKVLDLPTSKGAIDGSKVYDYFLKGKFDEIYEYCKKDVILTRQVYKRMIFEN